MSNCKGKVNFTFTSNKKNKDKNKNPYLIFKELRVIEVFNLQISYFILFFMIVPRNKK